MVKVNYEFIIPNDACDYLTKSKVERWESRKKKISVINYLAIKDLSRFLRRNYG
jgi:hypothetical protein